MFTRDKRDIYKHTIVESKRLDKASVKGRKILLQLYNRNSE